MKTMKNILLIAVMVLSTSVFAQKLGHINSNELLLAMPERNAVEQQIKSYAQELETQLGTMSKEYQAKVQDYQAKEATMTDAIKKDKIKEITNLETRITEFQQTAQNDLQNKEESLLKPIIDKAKKAIEDVAKENNYTYIFDSGVGVLLYQKDSDDIMPMVKKKLGLL
ncbi:MAG: OmpH family outer membrane protein [Bacteroidetes bacterium]|nr:MAG: OmpH family outer membrane protein [Bacteroidota bacterium]MBL1143534.1 OmpH family outer membrane protein [Bacteroidota bacterium]NOG56336.1 OmpH family outer membrane protein [Bacteroidota bacterium]